MFLFLLSMFSWTTLILQYFSIYQSFICHFCLLFLTNLSHSQFLGKTLLFKMNSSRWNYNLSQKEINLLSHLPKTNEIILLQKLGQNQGRILYSLKFCTPQNVMYVSSNRQCLRNFSLPHLPFSRKKIQEIRAFFPYTF